MCEINTQNTALISYTVYIVYALKLINYFALAITVDRRWWV